MNDSSRREILAGALAAPALLALSTRSFAAAPGYPFTLGVASGEPTSDGIVLWTRIAPEPFAVDGGMAGLAARVRWELAEDAAFRRIVRHGQAIAEPAWGHSVHVEPRGLQPDRSYFYRFLFNGAASPVGRTRTAPPPGAVPARARFAFCSCQNYEVGYYDAYRHMVADEPDLILFLGDYIYEGAPGQGKLRQHINPEPTDLAGYRVRYANYKSDPLLQAVHQPAPWAVTWDDHEVANDYADNLDENNGDPLAFLKRRAAAYRAYWEHMPLRAGQRPDGSAMRLYRTLDWGALAQLQILDDRQFRAPRACQPPELRAEHRKYLALVPDCPELHAANRTMLGAAQEDWLGRTLGGTRARWNLLAQQTVMSSLRRVDPTNPQGAPLYSADVWAGYPAARDRIIRRWAEAGTPNPLVLGGDIHSFLAADLRHPDRPEQPVAAEFVGGSITSLFHDPYLKQEAARSGVAFAENEVRGYGLVDISAAGCDITFRSLADATQPRTAIRDLATFHIEAGRAGIAHRA